MADKIAHALYLKRPGQQNSRQHFILQAAAGARLFVSERIRSGGSEREWRAEKAVAVVLETRATIATTKRVLIEEDSYGEGSLDGEEKGKLSQSCEQQKATALSKLIRALRC